MYVKTRTIRKLLKIQTKIEYCTYLQIVGLLDTVTTVFYNKIVELVKK